MLSYATYMGLCLPSGMEGVFLLKKGQIEVARAKCYNVKNGKQLKRS